MKTENLRLSETKMFSGIITVLAAIVLLFSCKKGTVEPDAFKKDIVSAAKILDGAVLSGTITSESNETEVALNYNDGNKLILITKIPSAENIAINNMQSVEVITSKYGLIVKDASTNKVLLLPNNDLESVQKFKLVQPLFGKNFQSAKIYGTTIINGEKA